MAIEQTLQIGVRVATRLVLSPQLQQAIKLLPLSTLELLEMLEQELNNNPLLENPEADNGLKDDVDRASERRDDEQVTASATQESYADDDIEDILNGDYLEPTYARRILETAEFPSIENVLSTRRSLTDHLEEQLLDSTTTERKRRIGSAIIGNLDDGGYLAATVEEINSMGDWSTDEIVETLQIIQLFDPIGVAARDARECLLIQLEQLPRRNSIAECIVREHLSCLQNKQSEELSKRMKMSVDLLKPAIEIIQNLNPYPAASFSESATRVVRPDVTIQKLENDYIVVLNDDGMPQLRINQNYRSMAKDKQHSKADRKFLRDKLKDAVWLMRSIDQRKRTIFKVATSIAKFQRKFLDDGIEHLEPLTLRVVADEIEMAESTVSRVVNNKYVNTPQGVFELKYFFHSGIDNADGQRFSSMAIKQRIKKLIAAENSKKPLSDARISERLKQEGVPLARRTIAKYRESLKIPVSTQRRSLY